MESEDEFHSDPDYDVKQKANKNKKYSKENEYQELKETINF